MKLSENPIFPEILELRSINVIQDKVEEELKTAVEPDKSYLEKIQEANNDLDAIWIIALQVCGRDDEAESIKDFQVTK